MKIRIEIDKDQDEEIIIKCNSITERINNIQRFIEYESIDKKIKLFKDNIEYYIDLKSILFFETDDLFVSAHTKDNVFQTKYKLYELENTLPNYFVRVSKSAILNINHIYSINRNITSSSTVIFNNTYKKVYVSRMYYKLLKKKWKEGFLMKISKIFWGLFFILAATAVVLSGLGVFAEVNLFSLLFTIFLGAILIKSIWHLSFTGILFSIAFILIIYDNQLGITAITPWPILCAALFGSIGLSIIFGKHSHHHDKREFTKEELENNVVDINVSFGASSKYINTKELERVNASCSFGAAEIYFDNAQIKGDSAIVNLDISFAGVEIYIPRTWCIENKVNVSLGAVEEKNKSHDVTEKTIILTGKVSFAGVEIIYI